MQQKAPQQCVPVLLRLRNPTKSLKGSYAGQQHFLIKVVVLPRKLVLGFCFSQSNPRE